jgi:hydrogenase expression/formation protein HypD
MILVDEYRDRELVLSLSRKIHADSSRPLTLMEVCGTHTMAIRRFGIPSLLPDRIRLISGPGCPVCVTDIGYADHACALASLPDVTVTTFGDFVRVPGSASSLETERSSGADVRVVQSSLDALNLARENPERRVVFLGIGFETTAPTTAAAVLQADRDDVGNFFVLSAHKLMKPAMMALVAGGVELDGYVCPGHVSVVTGAAMYEEIVRECGVGCVIAGFEPADILQAILMLVQQAERGSHEVEIAYTRAVTWDGSQPAQRVMEQVFQPREAVWRGLGAIPGSGLALAPAYSRFDAEKAFAVNLPQAREPAGCRCGEVLKGICEPGECPLFAKTCTPENPVGACMVSSEGTCAAHYRYKNE